jgi:hypothetical protein
VLAGGANCTYTCFDIEQMWVWQLRGVMLCGVNFEWIPDFGCMCIEGRNCSEECIAARSADLWTMFALIIALAALFIAAFAWILYKQQRVSRGAERDQAHMRTVLQTDDAVRYIYLAPAVQTGFGV